MKKRFPVGLAIASILFLVSPPVWGYTETFYLRKNGPGTSPETAAGAWNLSDVNTSSNWDSDDSDDGKLGPNDRLIILDDDGPITGQLIVQRSGLPGKPITIQGEAGAIPQLNKAGVNDGGVLLLHKSHITIEDFEITSTHPQVYGNGISLKGDCNSITIRRMKIHGVGANGIAAFIHEGGQADNCVIEYNEVYNTGIKYDSGPSGISLYRVGGGNHIKYNSSHDNHRPYSKHDGNGIIIDMSAYGGSNYVYYNVLWDNDGAGVNITGSKHVYVYNNTIYHNSLNSVHGGIFVRYDSENVYLKNNVIYNNNHYDLHADTYQGGGPPSNASIDYNCYSTGNVILWGKSIYDLARFSAATNHEDHGNAGDPKFTNVYNDDFSLRSDSICIDQGIDLGAAFDAGLEPNSSWPNSVSTASQSANGTGWEIGAFVYKSGVHVALRPPKNLRVIKR